MSQEKVVYVPDDDAVFMAISAGKFYEADLALWTIKGALADREPTPGEQAHLEQLRQRRKDAYAELVQWTMTVEAMRMRAQA